MADPTRKIETLDKGISALKKLFQNLLDCTRVEKGKINKSKYEYIPKQLPSIATE